MPERFIPSRLDFERSPYTGMTWDTWMEAGVHLLRGIFRHIHSFQDPVVMPRQETEITYPHRESVGAQLEVEKKAEVFEGLTRSLFIAAPLLKNEPQLTLEGFQVGPYYKNQILRCVTPGDPLCVGTYEQLQEATGYEDPIRPFQQTVETCALVIGLWTCREVIWDTYTKEEKDRIAAFLGSFAHANTVPQNWRLFNMLDLAFLYQNGYPIDEEIMMDHASQILGYYAGDGWYRDGHCFDYYSCWAFQVYAPLWNLWYGYEKAPYVAERFEEYSNKLMETYPDFFDRQGHVTMWGRSNIYRCAAASAFDANLYLKNPAISPGLARRICSGSLLQFLTREDFYFQGLPTIGFYRQFAPLVQGYSCAESPFWLGKIFLCLALPKDHPFWSEREENGSWESLRAGEVKVTTLDGPGLCFSNHEANGATLLRSGKIVKNCGDMHGMWNYGKLSYHSQYPWEATPTGECPCPVESCQYVLKAGESLQYPNVCLWHGQREGVLYRRIFFNYTLERECMWMQAMNLADFPVAYGLFRADYLRLYSRPVTLTLGSFGFPDHETQVEERREGGAKAIILKGRDSQGEKKQLAMTLYDGWEEIGLIKSSGTNPDSEHSLVIYGLTRRRKQYGGAEPYFLLSQTLTRESWEDFLPEELFPVSEVCYMDALKSGGDARVLLRMKSGEEKLISFQGIEGALLL